MENIQNKSALIPSDEIRSEELLAEQKFRSVYHFAGTYYREIWYESAGRG